MENKLIPIMSKEYRNIHDWIRRRMLHVKKCAHCGKEGLLDNALIHGKNYEKNVNNFKKLCRKCHYHYDHPNGLKHSEETKIKIGIASKKTNAKYGISPNFIYSQLGKTTSEKQKMIVSEINSGEKHPMSKLTEMEVREILLNNSDSYLDISKKYNVTAPTISMIKNRKIWKKVIV